jgi:hypothetical protein
VICDLLVGIASGNQPENVDFALAQCLINRVFRKLSGNLRWDNLSSMIDGVNRLDQFPIVSF